MRYVEVLENTEVFLEEKHAQIAVKIKQQNPELPFSVKDMSLVFNPYVIGELQLDDLNISIVPRNPALNLASVFQIAAYTNLDKIQSSDFYSMRHQYKSTAGIPVITDSFYHSLNLLLGFGISGAFNEKFETSKKINGDIIFNKYNKHLIPFKGIALQKKEFSINTKVNGIIKAAVEKLLRVTEDKERRTLLLSSLAYFDGVDSYCGDLELIENESSSYYSSNVHYPVVLEYAAIILKDLKLSHGSGSKWHSFLEDSNNLFEKYVLKVLKSNMKERVEKFHTTKPYASIKFGEQEGVKSYAPDVVIDVNDSRSRARAVFDVKNKTFIPTKNLNNLASIVSSADLYQLIFYCNSLKTKVGGLIYPSLEDNGIIPITLSDYPVRLFLLSVNMNAEFDLRNQSLARDVEKILSYS